MTVKKRSYNAESRKIQAQETKNRILEVAQKLFGSEGFEHVTIEAIAAAAQVSIPTVYGLFRSKLGILKALVDKALPVEQFEELVRKVDLEKSPAQRLALSARIARRMYDAEHEQLGLLQGASLLDAELKALEIEREKRRYERQKKTFLEMAQNDVLLSDLSITKARDILWAFTGRDLYRMLVIERGWSSDEYELWVAESLTKFLLKETYNN